MVTPERWSPPIVTLERTEAEEALRALRRLVAQVEVALDRDSVGGVLTRGQAYAVIGEAEAVIKILEGSL